MQSYLFNTNSYLSMMKNNISSISTNPMGVFFMLIGITLVSKFIFLHISEFCLNLIWEINLEILISDIVNQNFNYVNAQKFTGFIDQIGTFLIPGLVLIKISKDYQLNINKIYNKDIYIIIVFLVILLSFTNILSFISANFDLSFLPKNWTEFLKEQQTIQEAIQSNFIGNSLPNFSINFIIMAITPAICEELFFRGTLQPILINWSKNKAIGIIVTSIIFGALHFQIENFLAIVFASVLFGYLYEIKKNLLHTIIIHLLFNTTSLALMHMVENKLWSESGVELIMYYVLTPIGLGLGSIFCYRFFKNK
ncbi:MAG: hypothetical protein CL846_04265 [Crocinitomicaceae bacterium]|nr:hypothetical protein [Crocinitomicaceae bacterium]